jgi:hypothetical protein
MATEKIMIGIDDQVVELTGSDKEAFIAQREADNAEALLLETEYEARKQQKSAILERLGLTEEELKVVLS